MKKIGVLLIALVMALSLTACGSKCKECGEKAYKDGYCEYHYALHTAEDMVGDAAGDLFNSLLG